MTLPWSARYSAYGIWVVLFVSVLLVEAALPGVRVSIPPVWELVLTILATYALTGVIDHDRPLTSVWELLWTEARALPRSQGEPAGAHRGHVGSGEGEPCSERPGVTRPPRPA